MMQGPELFGETVSAVPTTRLQAIYLFAASALTTLGALAGIWLKKKRPKSGAEDAVYEINRATIEDQRQQIVALRAENAALSKARGEFEAALMLANANLQIAQQAAATAAKAAADNVTELEALRGKWLRARQYIHTLHTTLAEAGLDIPPEPEG